MKIEKISTNKIKGYAKNSRLHTKEQIVIVSKSIQEFGFCNPILVDENNIVIAGHCRLEASKLLGMSEVPCVVLSHLTDKQKKAYIIADNRLAERGTTWDTFLLKQELTDITTDGGLDFFDVNCFDFDFEIEEEEEEEEERDTDKEESIPDIEDVATTVNTGDIWQLGKHRLICGDSTKEETYKKLMGNSLARVVLADPPYGMKKEKDGVLNDNLNYKDLLNFNAEWIPLAMHSAIDVGSVYIWGIDEPLMDIYSGILKPLIASDTITFRNLITWSKGLRVQGINNASWRSYPRGDEKCLFFMKGVQGFNTNSDNYFDGWEPIRQYLLQSRLAMNWDVPTMKTIVGHSDKSRDHWTNKSQWAFIPENVYLLLQREAEQERLEKHLENDAFKRDYVELKKEYEEIKKEFTGVKNNAYSARAFFNNTHDKMTNVWEFATHFRDGSEGGHATPKPIPLLERCILSSSPNLEDIILDPFLGSGSTLIACEKTGRICYGIELDPKYCDVIISRWEIFSGKKAVKVE